MSSKKYVTEADALNTYQYIQAARNAKRLERYESKHNITRATMNEEQFKDAGVTPVPTKLPDMDDSDARDLYTMRFPSRLMAFVRTKADLEDLDVSAVIFNALEAYVEAPIGAGCVYLTDEELASLPSSGDSE